MYFKFHLPIPLLPYSFGASLSTTRGINFNFVFVKKPVHATGGYTSYCKDGKHVLFFDFDNIDPQEMLTELKILQKHKRLSDIYIFEMPDKENSFHAVCLDKMPLYDAIGVISQTSADRAFKHRPLKCALRRWVLRMEPKGHRKKPEPLTILRSKYNVYPKSTAHRKFLEMHYFSKIGKLINEDGYNTLDYFKYNTAGL